jgi:hypothetical protein
MPRAPIRGPIGAQKHDPHTIEDLEAELEEVRRELAAKERRNGGTQMAAFFAVITG